MNYNRILNQVLIQMKKTHIPTYYNKFLTKIKPMRTLFILMILGVFPFVNFAQTPVVMSNQSSNAYSENFSDIGNWTNNFATGIGASAWGSVAVNATGSIGDGVKTTVSTATKYRGLVT